jgi:hypothetical protein
LKATNMLPILNDVAVDVSPRFLSTDLTDLAVI